MASEAGKGPGLRAGANDEAFRDGYDQIDWGAKCVEVCERCGGTGVEGMQDGGADRCSACLGAGEAAV